MSGRHSRRDCGPGEDLAGAIRTLSDDDLVEVARQADDEEAALVYERGLLESRARLVAAELDRRGVPRVAEDGDRQLRPDDLEGLLSEEGTEGLPGLENRATGVLRAALVAVNERLSLAGQALGRVRELALVAHAEIERRDDEASARQR